MSQHITLFARFKRFINDRALKGVSQYTTKELMREVGCYETSTNWKRSSNNHTIVLAQYQTQLSELGAITNIKRGVWQINSVIPAWFSTLHIAHLLYGKTDSALQDWQQQDPRQKQNPFRVYTTRLEQKMIAKEIAEETYNYTTMSETTTPTKPTSYGYGPITITPINEPAKFKPYELSIRVETQTLSDILKAITRLNITIPDLIATTIDHRSKSEGHACANIKAETTKLLNYMRNALLRNALIESNN